MGVVSRHERDVVNAAQLERFARAFGLPLFRWKLPLLDELPNVDLNDLYNAEPSLWGYFVEGAPINLTDWLERARAREGRMRACESGTHACARERDACACEREGRESRVRSERAPMEWPPRTLWGAGR